MKIIISFYIVLSLVGLLRISYEIIDCLVSYQYETVDIYGHLNSKFLWLLLFAFYILISIVLAIIGLVKLRKK